MDAPIVKTSGEQVEITVSKHTLIDIAITLVIAGVLLYTLHRIVDKHM